LGWRLQKAANEGIERWPGGYVLRVLAMLMIAQHHSPEGM